MSDRTRSRAFGVAVAAVAVVFALLVLVGSPRRGAEERDAREAPRPRAVTAAPVRQAPPETTRQDVRDARRVAQRFTPAYLARESGRLTQAAGRTLLATTTKSLWLELSAPVRVTPDWSPPRSSGGRVVGVTAGERAGTLAATVAYRRNGRPQSVVVVLTRQEGPWRVSRVIR